MENESFEVFEQGDRCQRITHRKSAGWHWYDTPMTVIHTRDHGESIMLEELPNEWWPAAFFKKVYFKNAIVKTVIT